MNTRRFEVQTHLDGVNTVTVEIAPRSAGDDWIVSVRPKHKRHTYRGMLSDVAQFVAARSAKADAAAAGIPIPKPRKGRSRI